MSSDPCPAAFIDLAQRLADAAADVAFRYFREPLEVIRKPDDTPVTRADREAEAVMRDLIAAACPDHGIVGEEAGRENTAAEYVWVLDPIDGTKRFITGNAVFGTLIALLRGGQPILGVINMPILRERWVGATGQPTRFTDHRGTREVRVRPCPALAEAYLYATSPQMFLGADFLAFERVRGAVKTTLYGGECYAYGLLAGGAADLVIEADMGIYDFLAHVPVIEGAGGVMTDWEGRPLGLDSGDKVLAAGDGACHQAARAQLQAN